MEATPRGTADLPSRTIERCTGINSNSVHGGSSSSFCAAVIRIECNITQFLFPLDVKKIDYLSHDRVINFGNLNYLPITMIFGLIFLFLVKNIN